MRQKIRAASVIRSRMRSSRAAASSSSSRARCSSRLPSIQVAMLRATESQVRARRLLLGDRGDLVLALGDHPVDERGHEPVAAPEVVRDRAVRHARGLLDGAVRDRREPALRDQPAGLVEQECGLLG